MFQDCSLYCWKIDIPWQDLDAQSDMVAIGHGAVDKLWVRAVIFKSDFAVTHFDHVVFIGKDDINKAAATLTMRVSNLERSELVLLAHLKDGLEQHVAITRLARSVTRNKLPSNAAIRNTGGFELQMKIFAADGRLFLARVQQMVLALAHSDLLRRSVASKLVCRQRTGYGHSRGEFWTGTTLYLWQGDTA